MERTDVLVVGSGFSGLCMAIRLRRDGRENFLVLEKADRVGGTWRDNDYPGSGCDVPSFLYSFSFEPSADWRRAYGEQPEILAYLEMCARKHDILPRVRFGTEVAEAAFDEEAREWRVRATDGREFAARTLVVGTGQLSRPKVPAFPGLTEFAGPAFHSARWRRDVDLCGKRVAVVGSGASAIQFVPRIAPEVERLHLFQRSPNWIAPKLDRELDESERRRYRRFRVLERLLRWSIYWKLELRWPLFAGNERLRRAAERQALGFLKASIPDPELRTKLRPDHRIGCRRILISNDWYPALRRDNVEVVVEGIERFERDAIVSTDGRRREIDAAIFATGFETSGFVAPMRVVGRGGLSLADAWRDGPEAYLGMTVPGFPNFFLLYGPNTNLGHNSIVFMIECQVGYVAKCLRAMRARGLKTLEVRRRPYLEYNRRVQRELRSTVWAAGCGSWYEDANGRLVNNWSGGTLGYWRRTREPAWGAFRSSR